MGRPSIPRRALGFSLKINMPGYLYTHAVATATYGQLGMTEAAQNIDGLRKAGLEIGDR
jgi:hypothetical protein